ncbi:MAG: dTMP kinase [Candidatus Eisenbacteria bacterium]|nr:dTMP kinase [Candidatus Eisenbacteria bacterium]
MAGLFVTLEGIEGCGKTTQAELLKLNLEKEGHRVVFTREPGGTRVGERIREILLDNRMKGMEPLTELFLYLASRAQHVRELIRPALDEGAIVVCDRFSDASVAYQGGGRRIGTSRVLALNDAATSGLVPDYTVLLDLPVELGLDRMSARVGGKGRQDRIEREELEFHVRVRDAYLALAQESSGRIEVFDGMRDREELAHEILGRIKGILNRR